MAQGAAFGSPLVLYWHGMVGPAYLDSEVLALGHISLALARDRAEYVTAGVANPTARWWTSRLAELDPLLRMRWCARTGWNIDRWAEGCWNTVGVLGFQTIRLDLIEYLKSCDMQRWPSPEAYLEWKRASAARVRRANDAKSTDKVLAAVDSMTDKRVKEFIAVERAVQTRETVVMHGETKKQFDRMVEAGRQAPVGPPSASPGLHPLRHRRKTGGRHIRE